MKRRNHFMLAISLLLVCGVCGCEAGKGKKEQEIKVFTGFFDLAMDGIDENNVAQDKIAEIIGAKCNERFLQDNETTESVIGNMVVSGEYPDFIHAGREQAKLLGEKALIPIDEYWDEYDNLRNYFSEEEWNRLRADDGHIYFVPQFGNTHLYDTTTVHSGEAFWIQLRVLEWAGYPKIVTLDDYFDLIERYLAANPIGDNGQPNIGYEILTEGYLYFCLENPPQFLDGYPNDGCCIVDTEKLEAIDYNTTPTAKRWFKKLNEAFHKGLIDPQCFVLTTDQYQDKLKSGNVLGMVDQHWNFSHAEETLDDLHSYIPLDIVIDEGIEPHYNSSSYLDNSQGLSITISCTDVEGAIKFIDDLLRPDILTLRSWGIKGVNYEEDENGVFYQTEEQSKNFHDPEYAKKNLCSYGYFPFYLGMNFDGINTYIPDNQPAEFYKQLSEPLKECFSAYGVETYTELLNQTGENPPWFPMWTYTNTFTADTPYGKAKEDMDNTKHRYLPRVVMSDDFETTWAEYQKAYYEECDIPTYLDALTKEIKLRAGKE